jgi:bla regulator protein BlaR1
MANWGIDRRTRWNRAASRGALLAGVCAGLLPAAFLIAHAVPMRGQILHASEPLPSFEVVSIRPWQPKPSPTPSDGSIGRPKGPLKVDPGSGGPRAQTTDRVHFIGQAVLLIASAYKLPLGHENQILGAPDWVRGEGDRYEIQAKIGDSQFAAMQPMTPAQQQEQVAMMEQSLLADRFKLKVHFETREMPMYALVVAKGGVKLTPAKEGETSKLAETRQSEQGTEATGTAMTLDQFAHSVLLFGGKTVVNQTGLQGAYDFTLTYGREQPDTDGAGAEAPPVMTAVEEQLGLKLVPSKASTEVIVIDAIERPTEN